MNSEHLPMPKPFQDPNAIAEEVALVRKQESYIAQLEKETQFCREQLANVLAQMREVLTEKEAMSRSAGVEGFSGIFKSLSDPEVNNSISYSAVGRRRPTSTRRCWRGGRATSSRPAARRS